MTDDDRVAEILNAVLIWKKENEHAATARDAWHFEDYENLQREAWTRLTDKVSKLVRKES